MPDYECRTTSAGLRVWALWKYRQLLKAISRVTQAVSSVVARQAVTEIPIREHSVGERKSTRCCKSLRFRDAHCAMRHSWVVGR